MTAPAFSLRNTIVLALQQIALAALLSLLLAGWLHIPDANAFEIASSVVLALLIVILAGAGESLIAFRLVKQSATTRRLLLGTGIFFAAALLWYAISHGIDRLSIKEGDWAGYLNSRFPASLRNLFSFEHLYLLLSWIINALRWLAGGLLSAAAFASLVCAKPLRKLLSIFRSLHYWLSLLLLAIVGSVVTDRLLSWTPGHGLRIEMLSLILRITTVIVLNAISIALLLQALAAAILPLHSAGTDAPETIQPRTAEDP